MALQGCEKNLSSPRCGKKQKMPGRHVYVNPRALKRYRISEVVYNTVPRMVLKTAEGISGIADESPGVNLFVPQKRLLLPSGKREQANLAVHWLVLSHTVYLERWRVRH